MTAIREKLATKKITGAGLTVKRITQTSSTVGKGFVISQNPLEGERVSTAAP